MNRRAFIACFLAMLVWCSVAIAQLTPSQLSAIKTDVIAASDQAMQDLEADPTNADKAFAVADLYNATASPTYIVWRTDVEEEEIMLDASFDWTRVDNLSVGKARIWDWMFRPGSIDASKSNIRAGIDAVWVGTAADLAVRAAVYVHCKRQATRIERLLATGTGSDGSPGTMTFEGLITHQDILQAMQQ